MPLIPERYSDSVTPGSDEFSRHYQARLQTADPVATARSLRCLFAELLKRFEQNIRFDHLGFSLHDSARNTLVTHALVQKGEFDVPSEIPVEGSLALILQQHRTIEVRDVETETDFADLRAMAKRIGFRSFRIIPLTTERRVLGTMAVSRVSPGGFPEEDIRFVKHVAELVALVLENALMAEVLGKERSRLETLLNVSTALVSSLNVHKLFQEVSASIRRVVRQGFTHLALYDENADAIRTYVLNVVDNRDFVPPETLVPSFRTSLWNCICVGGPKGIQQRGPRVIDSDVTRLETVVALPFAPPQMLPFRLL